jgi:hypothetical protein
MESLHSSGVCHACWASESLRKRGIGSHTSGAKYRLSSVNSKSQLILSLEGGKE